MGESSNFVFIEERRTPTRILNLSGFQTLPNPLKYRWSEILNKSASRKCSAIRDDKEALGSLLAICIFSADHPVGKKKSHSKVTEPCICIHSTMETVRMLFSGDLCVSVTAALPQYAEVAHLDRSYPGFHILNGSWDSRVFSQWLSPGFNQTLLSFCDKAARVATGHSEKFKMSLFHSLNSRDIHGSNSHGSVRAFEASSIITDFLCPTVALFPDSTRTLLGETG